MFPIILQAAENFCIHQIREPYTISDETHKKRTLIAYIDIETANGSKYRVYVACENAFVQKIAQIFLEEDASDEETLKDMVLETLNLIVGSAKVLAKETEAEFTISTPHFVAIAPFEAEHEQASMFMVGSNTMILAIKEIDG